MKIKLLFYIHSYLKSKIPKFILRKKMQYLRRQTVSEAQAQRINYYCQRSCLKDQSTAIAIKDYRFTKPSSYHFDLLPYLGYFDAESKMSYLFGDLTHIPQEPSIVKSRPIAKDNQNAVVLNSIPSGIFVL